MRGIDRDALLEEIALELQSRMTYERIDAYLNGLGVDVSSKYSPSINSKRVYSRSILSDESDDLLFQIAEELEIRHSYVQNKNLSPNDSKFWRHNYFKVFLSHLSKFKGNASNLQKSLLKYGISSFVAHEDIEPTKEWREELENALFTMDVLVAILTPEFNESDWTDHEIGVAVGRDVLVIPINKGLNPYGFIAKYQALPAKGQSVGEVALSIFEVIISHGKTKGKMVSCLIDQLLSSQDEEEALRWLQYLDAAEFIANEHGRKIRDGFWRNTTISSSNIVVDNVNVILKKSKLDVLENREGDIGVDDNIPF